MRVASSKSERKNPASADFCAGDKLVARSRKRSRWLAMYSATDAEISLICWGERLGEGIVGAIVPSIGVERVEVRPRNNKRFGLK